MGQVVRDFPADLEAKALLGLGLLAQISPGEWGFMKRAAAKAPTELLELLTEAPGAAVSALGASTAGV